MLKIGEGTCNTDCYSLLQRDITSSITTGTVPNISIVNATYQLLCIYPLLQIPSALYTHTHTEPSIFKTVKLNNWPPLYSGVHTVYTATPSSRRRRGIWRIITGKKGMISSNLERTRAMWCQHMPGRVEWYSTVCDFRKRALCCRSGTYIIMSLIPKYQRIWSRTRATSVAKFSLSIFIFQKWENCFWSVQEEKIFFLQILLLTNFVSGETFKKI